MFGRRPWLPIDLLFPTRRMQTLTRTIDQYVASLYDRLRKSLVIAQDCAIKEAQRQKRLYDHKVGAIGEPVWCNHLDTSDVPTGTATDRNPQTGCDGDNSVPGCSLQDGMDLTVYMAVIEDPEWMSSRIGREVRAGAPRNVAGQMIVKTR